MRLLILGGTRFVGRHIVEAARDRGYEITLFNRGETNPGLFEDVEQVHGDRDGGLEGLESGSWDVAVDVSGYAPRVVRQSAELLADKVGHYTFISSISVFEDFKASGMDEGAPLAQLDDPSVEEVTNETYGALKAHCEQVVREHYPHSSTIVRPGLVAGPHDPTDRFTYWVVRADRGGRILAPGDPNRGIQFIDARDLARFTLDVTEAHTNDTFNVTGPVDPLPMEVFLDECRAAVRKKPRLVWVDDDFLTEHLDPGELPLWVPATWEALRGFMSIDCGRALWAGLSFRPVSETIKDTLKWWHEREDDGELQAGIDAERERELLDAYKAAAQPSS